MEGKNTKSEYIADQEEPDDFCPMECPVDCPQADECNQMQDDPMEDIG